MKKVLAAILSALVLSVSPLSLAKETASTHSTREKIETRKEKVRDKKEKIETKIENLREKTASKEAALREKLAKFRDTKKAAVVERVNINLNQINTRRTAEMAKFLENTTKILNRLQTFVSEQTASGKDVTTANLSITEAKAKIASASAAVSAQAAKDYTVSISSESAAKADTMIQRNNLHTDLKTVKKQVTEAKQAVANAIRISKTTLGGENGK